MRKIIFVLFIAFSLIQQGKEPTFLNDVILKNAKSEFGLEDVDGRLEYERLITADPKTGEIPKNIRNAEITFAERIDELTERARINALDFESAGPANVGGRTRAVALDVRDEDVILAGGVSGGIWKSTNGGITWERKSDPGNRNSITCIVQDTRPGREDTWYHGTGELFGNSARGGGAAYRGNGIYKSTDNGETWNVIPSTEDSEPSVFNSQFQYIWNIELNELNLTEDEILVAAYGGILRSVDGGDTWEVEIGQRLYDLDPAVDLNEINASFFTGLEKGADGVFYAALSTFSSTDDDSPDAGLYVSPEGQTWYEIAPFTEGSGYRRVVISHSPSSPTRSYWLIDSNPAFLLRFNLTGFNAAGPLGGWSNLTENVPRFGGDLGDFDAQGSFNMTINVHPEDPDLIFLGGTNLYRSTTGFFNDSETNWVGGYNPEGGSSVYLNHHPDQHEVVFYPSDPNKILSANDGGLFITRDVNSDSVRWTSANNGYLTSQFFTIALSEDENDDAMIGGMQDNGTDATNGSLSWSNVLGGDGGYAATTPGKEVWFSSFQNGQTFLLNVDQDFDLTYFARVDPAPLVADAGSAYLFINPFLLDPTNHNRMFMAGGNHLYVNENVAQIPGGSQEGNGIGWERVNDLPIEFGVVSAIDISLDGSTLYYGSSNGLLYKVIDADNTTNMESVEITDASFPEDAYLSSIAVNPADSEHLLVIFSNYLVPSIFESTNGGESFVDVSGVLEEFTDGSGNGPSVRWGEIIPTNSGTTYLVGTSTGLYSTESTSSTSTPWTREAPDLIGSAVVMMMDYRPSDGRLAVATHGNGVFTTTIDDFQRIEQERTGDSFNVVSNYPNPFSESTRIVFDIPEDDIVKVSLYSRKGELVRNILWGKQFAGENSVVWDGKNAAGTTLANGIYLYTIEYRGNIKSGKLQLIN